MYNKLNKTKPLTLGGHLTMMQNYCVCVLVKFVEDTIAGYLLLATPSLISSLPRFRIGSASKKLAHYLKGKHRG
jgi:hypothetical protein